MKLFQRIFLTLIVLAVIPVYPEDGSLKIDEDIIAKIREEGFQRSQVMNIAGYMCDVLGARLTLSQDMKRAQTWAIKKMEKIGLVNTAIEPFMDYGVTWDNEYFSLHLLEPDYQPMVGYPLTHTPGTGGKKTCRVIIANIQTKKDLEKFRGKLSGAAVLSTLPAKINLARLARGAPRRTLEELQALEKSVIPKPRRRRKASPPKGPGILKAWEKIAFFKTEGVIAVFECRSGGLAKVRGFSRPGTKKDKWSAEKSRESLPIIAITPEHYNRMYRILERNIPVTVEIEVRNRLGTKIEKACNLLGEIPGTDLKNEIVMIGAHFDTWHASPNASDNTSGCAVILEAARILKAIGARPRRTIRVALWGGEEQGIYGSREYVHKNFGNPYDTKVGIKPAYNKLSVYFNQDYGAGAYLGIYLQGNEYARRYFSKWMNPLKDMGFSTISIQSVGSTDHVSFDRAGLPGFQFIQDRIPGTAGHTNLDFFDSLQADDLMKNAVIMAVFAYHSAMINEKIPRKTRPAKREK